MEVMFDNEIGDCPGGCQFAQLDTTVDVLNTPNGVIGLYITAYCEHAEVCTVRRDAVHGDD